MATSAAASILIPRPVEIVWSFIRDFTFIKCLSGVESVQIVSGSSGLEIGAIRQTNYHDRSWRRSQLTHLSDEDYSIQWALLESDPPAEVAGLETHITLIRNTECNNTLAIWEVAWAAQGTSPEHARFEAKSALQNLRDLRKSLGCNVGRLQHVHEGPSSRVMWLCRELALPLELVEHQAQLSRSGSAGLLSPSQGGLLTAFHDPETHSSLLESGAIVTLLLERHDQQYLLAPAPGTKERALYHQMFFFACSTLDPLMLAAYKVAYVGGAEASEEDQGQLQLQFLESAVPILEKVLETGGQRWICGEQFTAADVQLSWPLYVANLLGWMEALPRPILTSYFLRLRSRPHFSHAFFYDGDRA